MRNITLYVKDILQYMREAEEFIEGLQYDEFASTRRPSMRSRELLRSSEKRRRIFLRASAASILLFLGRRWQECVTR